MEWVVFVVVAGFSWPLPALAGNYGYNVTYNSKVERGEMEVMFMNDITQPSAVRRDEGQGTYLSHMVELEYGFSSQLATEFMVEWYEDLEKEDRRFTGFRWETRYRLFDREVPLNPMLYAEYEDLDPSTRFKMEVSGWIEAPYDEAEEEIDRERILETRLVLSHDFGPVNVAFNWINETDLASGFTGFGYSAGLMWMIGQHAGHAMGSRDAWSCPMHPEVEAPDAGPCPRCGMALKRRNEDHHGGRVGVGLELYGGLGDTKAFGFALARQEHYLAPILMYHFTERLMMHAQLAIGLSKASDNLVRLNFGYDF